MARNRDRILGMQHIRINCFSFRLRYLKVLVKMFALKEEIKGRLRK
jgi:hypothetical protein